MTTPDASPLRRSGPRTRLRRLGRAVLLLPVLLTAAWAAGFGWFLHAASRPPPLPPHADAIVALTGGAERVETALHLLLDGYGARLLVSGVNPAADFDDLARRAGVTTALSNQVTLGKAAFDTHGNALETAGWVRQNDIRSLIVVTAGYHMPRALAELSRTMPDVTLHPYPVLSPILRNHPDAASLRLLAAEYTKWIAAEAGFSAIVAPHGAPHAGPREHRDGAREPQDAGARASVGAPSPVGAPVSE